MSKTRDYKQNSTSHILGAPVGNARKFAKWRPSSPEQTKKCDTRLEYASAISRLNACAIYRILWQLLSQLRLGHITCIDHICIIYVIHSQTFDVRLLNKSKIINTYYIVTPNWDYVWCTTIYTLCTDAPTLNWRGLLWFLKGMLCEQIQNQNCSLWNNNEIKHIINVGLIY